MDIVISTTVVTYESFSCNQKELKCKGASPNFLGKINVIVTLWGEGVIGRDV